MCGLQCRRHVTLTRLNGQLAFLKRSGCCAGKGVDPKVIEQVRENMMACSLKCQNAMRAEGIKVLALFSQDVGSLANIKCHVQTAKWRRILDVRSLLPPSRSECRGGCLRLRCTFEAL